MAVKIIRFSETVNASEAAAQTKCKAALEALGDSAPWIVFAGLASSSSPLHQSDDLDLVPIGPGGVLLIEVKHWDAASAIANYLILRVTDQDARALARNVAPSEIERRTADRLKTLPKYEALLFSEGQRQPVHLQLTKHTS